MNETVRPAFHGFEQIPLREYAVPGHVDAGLIDDVARWIGSH